MRQLGSITRTNIGLNIMQLRFYKGWHFMCGIFCERTWWNFCEMGPQGCCVLVNQSESGLKMW